MKTSIERIINGVAFGCWLMVTTQGIYMIYELGFNFIIGQ